MDVGCMMEQAFRFDHNPSTEEEEEEESAMI